MTSDPTCLRAVDRPAALPSNAVRGRNVMRISQIPAWSAVVPGRLRRRRREPSVAVPEWARVLVTAPAAVLSDRSAYSVMSHRSIGSIASAFSAGSVMSAGSLLSVGSLASIASSGSILSIASSGSILSIGASGGFLRVGGGRAEGDATASGPAVSEATVRRLSGLLALSAIVSAPFARRAAA
jgi:hypothetical protein